MSTPLISIIIPVYNVEKCIIQCLDSVVAQIYTNWECLLVNDGSKDSSGSICDEYAAKDPRFKVFHKKNGGVSSARNLGIENMNGKWVIFVDSDDYLPQDAIHNLLLSAERNNCDMALGNYIKINTNGSEIPSDTYDDQRLLQIVEALTLFFVYPVGHFQGYLWNRLMRTSVILLNNLKFNEKIYYKEDGLFLIQYLLASKKMIAFVPDVVYHYMLQETGAMQSASIGYNDKYLTNLDARLAILREIKTKYPDSAIIKLAKDSVVDVVKIIIGRRPSKLSNLIQIILFITKRLIRANMLAYSFKSLLISKYNKK